MQKFIGCTKRSFTSFTAKSGLQMTNTKNGLNIESGLINMITTEHGLSLKSGLAKKNCVLNFPLLFKAKWLVLVFLFVKFLFNFSYTSYVDNLIFFITLTTTDLYTCNGCRTHTRVWRT